jgi:DNA integrity scanning protein DisA with diadenylate cyclase activity
MESLEVVQVIFGILLTILGWFAKTMWLAIKELANDLADLREELPKEYVPKSDYRQDVHDIKEMLSKLFDKLDTKADR